MHGCPARHVLDFNFIVTVSSGCKRAKVVNSTMKRDVVGVDSGRMCDGKYSSLTSKYQVLSTRIKGLIQTQAVRYTRTPYLNRSGTHESGSQSAKGTDGALSIISSPYSS